MLIPSSDGERKGQGTSYVLPYRSLKGDGEYQIVSLKKRIIMSPYTYRFTSESPQLIYGFLAYQSFVISTGRLRPRRDHLWLGYKKMGYRSRNRVLFRNSDVFTCSRSGMGVLESISVSKSHRIRQHQDEGNLRVEPDLVSESHSLRVSNMNTLLLITDDG